MYHGETAEGERGQGKSGCAGATVWAVFRQDMLCRTKFRYGTKSVGRDYAGVPTSHGKGTEFTIRLLSVKFVWINDDRRAFARCERERGGSPAPTMLNIRHHNIGMFNEPAVSSGDSVAWWNIFQRRIQRIIVELKVYISGKISEDQRGFNVGKLGFQLMNNLGSHKVKSPVTTQEKDVRALSNKIANNFSQPAFYLNRVFKCPMSAKCYGNTVSLLYSGYNHYIGAKQDPYNIFSGVMRCRFPFDQCGSLWNKRRSPSTAWQMKGSTLRLYRVFGTISR